MVPTNVAVVVEVPTEPDSQDPPMLVSAVRRWTQPPLNPDSLMGDMSNEELAAMDARALKALEDIRE